MWNNASAVKRNTFILALVAAAMTISVVGCPLWAAVIQVADELDPSNYDWENVPSYSISSYYLIGSDGKCVLVSIKKVYAVSSLEDSHCKTDYGTKLKHYHYERDFSGSEVEEGDNFWNWFYDQCSGIDKETSVTNKTNCLCYAMHGWAGNATYNYWVNPGPTFTATGNDMFVDDCDIYSYFDPGDPPGLDAEIDDRISYFAQWWYPLGHYDVLGHATKVVEAIDGEPQVIEWKMSWSGVYNWDVSSHPTTWGFSTPGVDQTKMDLRHCQYPGKEDDRHEWGYWLAVVWKLYD